MLYSEVSEQGASKKHRKNNEENQEKQSRKNNLLTWTHWKQDIDSISS